MSYVFKNKRKKKEDILNLCNSYFDLKTLRNNSNTILLSNNLLTILIKKNYTHIILKNKCVNIEKIEEFFN